MEKAASWQSQRQQQSQQVQFFGRLQAATRERETDIDITTNITVRCPKSEYRKGELQAKVKSRSLPDIHLTNLS